GGEAFERKVSRSRIGAKYDQSGTRRDHGQERGRLQDRRREGDERVRLRDLRVAPQGTARHHQRLRDVRRHQARSAQRPQPAHGARHQDSAREGSATPSAPHPPDRRSLPTPLSYGVIARRRGDCGGSSSGRTRGSGPRSGGSNPPPPATSSLRSSAPSSRGPGHGPLKAETRVRIPLGPPPNLQKLTPR